jgi:hypothetical protein
MSNSLQVTKWRAYRKNTLRGFVDVRFPFGLTIYDITVHEKGARRWVGLPAKQVLEGDRAKKVDDKFIYTQMLGFDTRAQGDMFSDAVIGLLLEQHPTAFDPS